MSGHLAATSPPLVPEISTLEARDLIGLWEALEDRFGGPQEPPFWAASWPGSQALARYVLDHPEIARGRNVLDLGSGNGLAAVAARRAGASRVVANDIDSRCSWIANRHGLVNDAPIDTETRDRLESDPDRLEFDLLLVGDLFYAADLATRLAPWLHRARAHGVNVLIGEPGRDWALRDKTLRLASHSLTVCVDLESRSSMDVAVLTLTA